MGLLDLITEWFLKPFVDTMFEVVNGLLVAKGLQDVFYVERMLGIDGNILWSLQFTISGFAMAFLSAKLLHKLFNIYIIGTDGDNTVSPMEYLKSYVKGVAIIAGFTVIYSLIGDIVDDFMTDISTAIGNQSWENAAAVSGTFLLIFAFIYLIVVIVFYMNLVITGLRMLFIRLAIPMSCVGLIDNDNGVYSIFIKKFTQTCVTVVAQLALMQLSIIPLKSSSGVGMLAMTFMPYIMASAVLVYAMKIPQDLNEIFIAAPSTGAGQKMSAVGRGIQTAVSMFTKTGAK